MKAMILAAGEGRRLEPLSLKTPKPLLRVAGKPLIQYHIEALVKANIEELVINLSHLGEQIESQLSNGSMWGASIHYSHEDELLETGGGILNALHLLGDEPFVVVNGDIFTDYDFSKLPGGLPEDVLGHLVMVDNPIQHAEGDYGFTGDTVGEFALLSSAPSRRLTYSGIGMLRPELLLQHRPGMFPLREVFAAAIESRKLSGEYYGGVWTDVGTVDRLEALRQSLQ
jgi:MurNAc alpha-1-phosphate uridylyltransferase|tara:strand:+ start:1874 stop:2554 length:681 start_codon:yes stop_codon:yes gene_type:complete